MASKKDNDFLAAMFSGQNTAPKETQQTDSPKEVRKTVKATSGRTADSRRERTPDRRPEEEKEDTLQKGRSRKEDFTVYIRTEPEVFRKLRAISIREEVSLSSLLGEVAQMAVENYESRCGELDIEGIPAHPGKKGTTKKVL